MAIAESPLCLCRYWVRDRVGRGINYSRWNIWTPFIHALEFCRGTKYILEGSKYFKHCSGVQIFWYSMGPNIRYFWIWGNRHGGPIDWPIDESFPTIGCGDALSMCPPVLIWWRPTLGIGCRQTNLGFGYSMWQNLHYWVDSSPRH